ncbi:MAG TPA: TolC family protein [Bacteroidota bacterium]|nr:TolC family protein [Bacteroidota bacterium]
MMRTFIFNGVLLFAAAVCCAAEERGTRSDTVAVTLEQAEARFLNGNLQLLAARFNIDAAKAAAYQAEIWSNPNIAIEQNAYNKFTKKYFDISKTGNTEVQLQQLILLAGKRDKQIRLAEINTRIAENTFYDLLRALKFELRTDFFDLYFLQQSLAFYDETIPRVRKTVASTEAIYQKRSILLSEVLRLKSLLFSLENERLGLLNSISDIEHGMSILLRDSSETSPYFVPRLNPEAIDSLRIDSLSLQEVLAAAYEKRPDFKNAGAQVEYEETNLSLQKAMRVPDLTVGGRYSRAGSYIPDYYALTLSIDLPIFNRNQGNVEVSENMLEADKLLREYARKSLEREVAVAYKRAVDTDSLFRSFDKKFTGEYKTLVEGMDADYQKRNITIIEFTDFYESYRTSMLQMNQLQNDRMDAFEGLNYAAGTSLINP